MKTSEGCEVLLGIDSMIIEQQINLLEIVIEWEAQNKYHIKNSKGHILFLASEESNACARQFCGSTRAFVMNHKDTSGKIVLSMEQPTTFCACLSKIIVRDGKGNLLGTASRSGLYRFFCPTWSIHTAQGDHVLSVISPWCVFDGPCWPIDVDFKIMTKDKSRSVGVIKKKHRGIVAEAFTDAENFMLTFPKDLDWKMKSVLLGCAYLIDFTFFEAKGNR